VATIDSENIWNNKAVQTWLRIKKNPHAVRKESYLGIRTIQGGLNFGEL